MEIKQLEQELLTAVIDNRETFKTITKACASITIEHMKGFAEWISEDWKLVSYNNYTDYGWYWKGNEEYAKKQGIKTTEQLIQLYFDFLNKK